MWFELKSVLPLILQIVSMLWNWHLSLLVWSENPPWTWVTFLSRNLFFFKKFQYTGIFQEQRYFRKKFLIIFSVKLVLNIFLFAACSLVFPVLTLSLSGNRFFFFSWSLGWSYAAKQLSSAAWLLETCAALLSLWYSVLSVVLHFFCL